MSSTKKNDAQNNAAERYARILELLAAFEVEMAFEAYTELRRDNPDAKGSFQAFMCNLTASEDWREQLVEKLENAIDLRVNAGLNPVDKIKHVFYSGAWHALEVNGSRGERALNESPALHPDGFAAVTPYYGGCEWKGDKAAIPQGGQVWAVVPVPFDECATSYYDEKSSETSAQSHERFRRDDLDYDLLTPNAYAGMPEYQAARSEVERFAKAEAEGREDLVIKGRSEWILELTKRYGESYEIQGQHPDITAARLCYAHLSESNERVGAYRYDTDTGVVYAPQ